MTFELTKGLTAVALSLLTLCACSYTPPTALQVAGRDKLKGTTKTQGDFNLAHRSAEVAIDGKLVGEAASVRRLPPREAGSGLATGRRLALTLDPDSALSREFYAWRKAVLDGKVDRKSISVIFHNDAGEEVARYNFFEAWPVRWEGPDLNARNSGHATEALEIAYERFEMK